MNNENEAVAPWYKQRWLWFILSPLIAVFFYGTFFLYLSIVTADGVVKDDYYKVARGIELDSSKAEAAQAANLAADLTIDNLTGDVVLNITGSLAQWPELLEIEVIHPTHKKYDLSLQAKVVPGSQMYRANLNAPIKGKRYITISPIDQSWRLRKEISGPYEPGKFTLSADGQ